MALVARMKLLLNMTALGIEPGPEVRSLPLSYSQSPRSVMKNQYFIHGHPHEEVDNAKDLG